MEYSVIILEYQVNDLKRVKISTKKLIAKNREQNFWNELCKQKISDYLPQIWE